MKQTLEAIFWKRNKAAFAAMLWKRNEEKCICETICSFDPLFHGYRSHMDSASLTPLLVRVVSRPKCQLMASIGEPHVHEFHQRVNFAGIQMLGADIGGVH